MAGGAGSCWVVGENIIPIGICRCRGYDRATTYHLNGDTGNPFIIGILYPVSVMVDPNAVAYLYRGRGAQQLQVANPCPFGPANRIIITMFKEVIPSLFLAISGIPGRSAGSKILLITSPAGPIYRIH